MHPHVHNRVMPLQFVTCAASESCGSAQLGQGHGLCSCEKRAASRYLLILLPRCMLPDGLEAASIHDQKDFPGDFQAASTVHMACQQLLWGWRQGGFTWSAGSGCRRGWRPTPAALAACSLSSAAAARALAQPMHALPAAPPHAALCS